MTREDFETKFVPKFLNELKLKIISKGRQYGPVHFDSTVLPIANFEQRAPEQVCVTLMLKHLKAIQLAPHEQHRDRLEDLMIYCLLIAAFNPERSYTIKDYKQKVEVAKDPLIPGGQCVGSV